MLGKVLNLDVVEVAQTAMQGDISEVKALDFHALHQLAREVQACSRSGNGTFVFGKDTLEVIEVVLCSVMVFATVDDIAWQRSLAQ